MNFNFEDRTWKFVEHRNKFFWISALFLAVGLAVALIMGLNLGVDFESGTQLEVLIEESFTEEQVEDIFVSIGLEPDDVRLAGNDNEIAELLFIGTLSQADINDATAALTEQFEGFDQESLNESTISPDIAHEQAQQAVIAILLASVAVILYVSIRFEYRFAGAAIIALFHDALFIVAVFALLRIQVDITFIAAVLTIVGYSINDTIVIFDRIRENLKFAKIKTEQDLAQLVNRSIKETLPRTINTSITVVFAALCLFLFGGEGIRNFSFGLLIGLVAGAYSSIFIAAQVWFMLKKQELKKKAQQPQESTS